jgi:hypothetical protein
LPAKADASLHESNVADDPNSMAGLGTGHGFGSRQGRCLPGERERHVSSILLPDKSFVCGAKQGSRQPAFFPDDSFSTQRDTLEYLRKYPE